jgi:hypothetical protein
VLLEVDGEEREKKKESEKKVKFAPIFFFLACIHELPGARCSILTGQHAAKDTAHDTRNIAGIFP